MELLERMRSHIAWDVSHDFQLVEDAIHEIERLENTNADMANDIGYAKAILRDLVVKYNPELPPKARRFIESK